MMSFQSPTTTVKKLLLSTGLLGAGVILAPFLNIAPAAAIYYERTPRTFECRNSLDPQCENPPRAIESESWRCRNNPGPDCTEPPRIDEELARGNWTCRKNQNVVACRNPIRFTVPEEDRDNWPTYFPQSN